MEKTNFFDLTDDILEGLLEAIEKADEEGEIDVELQEGVLNINLNDGSGFVINRHEPTQQIWYSSPESGASKFSYNEKEGDWISNDDAKNNLLELFQEELEHLSGVSIKI